MIKRSRDRLSPTALPSMVLVNPLGIVPPLPLILPFPDSEVLCMHAVSADYRTLEGIFLANFSDARTDCDSFR